ncbi:MAG: MFS transporter [Alphaproteobacteria bacterium]|nr:MFS transporter [Alphaproteobacteria bacterium]
MFRGRGRPDPVPRPAEGHAQGGRRERGRRRDRILHLQPSGSEAGPGGRRARPAAGGGGGRLHRAEAGPARHRAGDHRVLQGQDRQLQGAAPRPLRHRVADVLDQDPEVQAARGLRGGAGRRGVSVEAAAAAERPYPAPTRAWQAVGVLSLATVFAFVDRHLLYILSEPVKQTLAITDTQISLLQGMAFVVFYTLFGPPIGILVDRRNRRNVVIGGILAWSVMTLTCGLATDFWTLAAARAGVGIGEACLAPAAFSMIADYFPPRLRGRAMACIVMSITLGSGFSYLIGGGMAKLVPGATQVDLPLLGATYGWQLTFFAAGMPGFLIAVLLLFVGEPVRRETASAASRRQGAAASVWAYVRRNRRLLFCLVFGAGMVSLVSYAVVAWMTALYVRGFGFSVAEIGPAIGLINIAAGLPGGLIGGYLSDHLARRGRGGRYNVLCFGTLLGIPVLFLWPFVQSATASLALLAATMFVLPVIVASVPSALQAVVPNEFRGQVTAVLYLVNGLLGTALGPLAIALATDYVFIAGGLRTSLMVVLPLMMAVGAGLAMLGRGAYERARGEMPETA